MQTKVTDESGDKKYFTIIPNFILNHSTLWDREVYIQMKRITGESGTCWTSRVNLAKKCGISLDRLKKSIKYLIDHQWIEKVGIKKVNTSGGIQGVNEYKIIDLWNLNNNYYNKGGSPENTPLPKGGSPNEQRGVVECSKGGSPNDDKEEHFNNNHINKRDTNQDFFSLKDETILDDFKGKIPNDILKTEVQKFILYWTEKNPTGKKCKWEMQQTFDVKRRLATWLQNTSKWDKSKIKILKSTKL